jgi:integrase
MSRRSGQVGYIEKKGNSYRVRFMLDVPGCERRVYKSKLVCPIDGPGSLNKFERERRAMEIIAEAGANSEATLRKFETATLSTTFKQQADFWIEVVQKRKRKPVKQHTVSFWKTALNYVNPLIGDIPLSAVNNKLVRDHVIAKMASETRDDAPRFSPKTITSYVSVVKMVVASAVDENGEALYPVKWNHDFMDLPEITEQNTPMFTGDEITKIVANAEGQFAVLYALLAGTGLRIGEALALHIEDVKGGVISVHNTLCKVTNELQSPKTKNGVREIDMHSSLAIALHSLIVNRRAGFVFQSEIGGPLHQSNLLRRSLHPILAKMKREACGFHSFRRFRNTHLRKARVPDGLIQYWMGHAPDSMTDHYDKVREDAEFRRFTVEQVGLGFIPPVAAKRVSPYSPHDEPSLEVVSVVK